MEMQSNPTTDGSHDSVQAATSLLKRCWPRWTEIVELFARRRAGRKRIREDDYRELHNSILEACRVLQGGADQQRRALYQDMGSLARPWVSSHSLGIADRQIVMRLLAQCREAHLRLAGRSRFSGVFRSTVLVFVLVFALGVGIVSVVPHLRGGGGAAVIPASDGTQSLFYLARYHMRRTTIMQRVWIGGAIVTVLTIAVVAKSAKKY